MSAMFLNSPDASKTATPTSANSLELASALVCRSRRTIEKLVPASSAFIPWSAKAARTATPSSTSMPNARIAGPALVVSAVENCSTDAFASVLALTKTSAMPAMFFRFAIASSRTVKPNADCASVSKSVANAMSNIPACANFATCGIAAIDASASKPALAKKKNDSAACSALNVVVFATSRAASAMSLRIASDTSPIMETDCCKAASNFANSLTETTAMPATAAVAAAAIFATSCPNFFRLFVAFFTARSSYLATIGR